MAFDQLSNCMATIQLAGNMLPCRILKTIKQTRVYFVKEGFTPSQNTHDCGSFVAK